MSRVCPPELQVKGFALNRLANNLGVTIGPAVGGILALRDYRLLFWADGLTCIAAAFIVGPAAGAAVYGHLGGDALWFGCAGVTALLAVAFSALRRSLESS